LSSFNIKVLYAFEKWQEALNLLYPLAIIFAAVWTKISFIKQNTEASFYALGFTRKEFAKPFLLISLFTYFLFVGLNFTSFATASDTASAIKKKQYGISKTEDLFFKYNNSFVYIETLIPQRYKMEKLTIFNMKNNQVVETFTAKDAWYNIYEWVALDVIKKSKRIDSQGDTYLEIEEIPLFHTLKNYQPKILKSIYDGQKLTLYESFMSYPLLKNQGLSTDSLRADIYSKMVMPLFSIALLMILLFSFPFHARYMNISATTMKALGGTLFTWGILFALQGMGYNGTILPEIAIILPIFLLFLYAFYTLKQSTKLI
jgi:lipopolysaccharide export system permease protein